MLAFCAALGWSAGAAAHWGDLMVDVTSGLTSTQAAAVIAVLNLADAGLRGSISAMIASTLGPPGFQPWADSAVLNAIGVACTRYTT